MNEEKPTCRTLLDLAKDEWDAFHRYSMMPDPYRTFAIDELRHFSEIAVKMKEQCPQYAEEIDKMIKTRQ